MNTNVVGFLCKRLIADNQAAFLEGFNEESRSFLIGEDPSDNIFNDKLRMVRKTVTKGKEVGLLEELVIVVHEMMARMAE